MSHFGATRSVYASRLLWYPGSASPWSSIIGTRLGCCSLSGTSRWTAAMRTAASIRASVQQVSVVDA